MAAHVRKLASSRGASTALGVAVAALGALFCATPAQAQDNPFSSCKYGLPISARGRVQVAIPDRPNATRWTFTGSVEAPVVIQCDDTRLEADEIVYDTDTRAIHASGHVLLTQPDVTLFAEKADMNGDSRLGTFYNAFGTAHTGRSGTEKSQFGTQEPDLMFSGEKIAKTGPREYSIDHGQFTTCVQPSPRWSMSESVAKLTLDKYAFLKNVVLKVKDVPMFYVPVLYYPINKEDRSTGFLLPSYGSSTIGGTTISNAFFWAINRSQDATFYHDLSSKTGQGVSGEYRYTYSPDSRGTARLDVLNEHFAAADAGSSGTTERSYRITGNANQALAGGLRMVGNVNYFSQISRQQLYQSVDDYANSERSFSAAINGGHGRYQFSATAEQTDYFRGLDQGDRNGRLPALSLRVGDKPLGRSRVYAGGSAEEVYLVNQSDTNDPLTDKSLWRFDGGPTIRAPLSNLSFLNVTTSASWHVTEWAESLVFDAAGDAHQAPVALTRQLLQMDATVTGPTFSRVFLTPGNHYADRFKHVIEPTFSISKTSTFNEFDRVVQIDSVDQQVGGVTQISYGLRNRVLARLAGPPAAPGAAARPGVAREIVTVSIDQRYYSDARAALYDPEYQSAAGAASAGTFSPIQINATVKPADEVSGTFRTEIDPKYRTIRSYSASAQVSAHLAQITGEWFKQRVIPGLAGFTADQASQFLSANTTLRTRANHYGGTYSFNYDVKNHTWVQQRFFGYYNTQCCGLNFDYQTRSTPLLAGVGVSSNHQFSVSFSLAGIGSFSNPMGSFGGR